MIRKKSDKEKLAAEIGKFREGIENNEKYRICIALNITERTLDNYLSGKIGSILFGNAILLELKKEHQPA